MSEKAIKRWENGEVIISRENYENLKKFLQ